MSDAHRLTAGACAVLLLCSCGKESSFTESFFALDTAVTVTSDRKVPEAVRMVLTDADRTFSKVCGKYDILTVTDAERVNFCIDHTAALNRKYNGRLDPYCGRLTSLWGINSGEPHIPCREEIAEILGIMKNTEKTPVSAGESRPDIDLGASAKGYAADMVYKALEYEKSGGYIIVSAESTILLYGEKEGGFNIGVRDPETDGDILGSFTVPCGFVSTAGGYERYFEENGVRYTHIFDTGTGYPVDTDLTSVTVYCEAGENGGLESDIMATLIYCEGSERLEEFAADRSISFIAVDNRRNIYVSGLDFRQQEGSGYICVNIGKRE